MTGLFKGILENETCLATRMSPYTAFRVITNPLKPKEWGTKCRVGGL